MNATLVNVDRSTHLKIVVLGLLAAVLVAGLAITAHLGAGNVMLLRSHTSVPGSFVQYMTPALI